MSEEIKFRGLCNFGALEGQWIYSETIFGRKFLIDGNWFDTKFETRGRFTGLRDKNGKEIYTGDLLKVSVIALSQESIHPDHRYQQDFIDEVKFESGHFYCKYFLWEIANNAEVIGNIHENQNLKTI